MDKDKTVTTYQQMHLTNNSKEFPVFNLGHTSFIALPKDNFTIVESPDDSIILLKVV